MKKNKILILILFTLISSTVLAHPGSLDSNGGHYNRKTGEYHYHDGTHTEGSSSSSTYNTFDDKKLKGDVHLSQKQKTNKKSYKTNRHLNFEGWFFIILIVAFLIWGLIIDFKNTLWMIICIPFSIILFSFELLWEILKGILSFFKKVILKLF